MMRKFILLFLFLPMVLITKGQDSLQLTMTYDDALQSAFMRNHAIAAQNYDIDYNRHMKKASWGLRLPQIQLDAVYVGMERDLFKFDFNDPKNAAVSAIADYFQQQGTPLSPEIVNGLLGIDLSFSLQKKNFGVFGTTAVWPLYMGGKINALNRANKIKISQSENELNIVKADLFTETTERYWGLALATNLEGLYVDVVDCINSHYQDALKLEQNGMISKTERMYAEMSLSQAKAQLAEAKNSCATVNSALSGSIGQEGSITPVTPLFITDSIPELQVFKDRVAENALLLNKVENLKKLAGEDVKAKRGDFFPTLSAFGHLRLANYELNNRIPKYIYGMAATFRVFDGLKTEQTYMASKSQLKRVEELQAKAEDDIQILTEKLYYEMMGAREQVYAMESTISFAEEYYRAKNAAFKEGMATSNDVVDAELNLAKCKLQRMSEAYKFAVSLSKLLALTGDWEEYSMYQMSGRIVEN